ncbi:uncharacterized protein BX663DRAFT_514507 [Cokeromyces recurvatus]|uniref:uncharacterized protein n=1 Tax=Cokeromyces recurvatus TaxID=90255 RepID=UPI00221F0B02|nr:uncharacterized protein BX663DRAFT_514507 [Cokeromyces recurvatus]KAI7901462.1 hypothetical protein BX663DRAFT_514507 [Cokeromyces recurvatus]
MITNISRTWRRISIQFKSNLNMKRKSFSSSSSSSTTSSTTTVIETNNDKKKISKTTKSVRFYTIDTIYYTHSSAEYDRSPSSTL